MTPAPPIASWWRELNRLPLTGGAATVEATMRIEAVKPPYMCDPPKRANQTQKTHTALLYWYASESARERGDLSAQAAYLRLVAALKPGELT
jgi:hypothetical protein